MPRLRSQLAAVVLALIFTTARAADDKPSEQCGACHEDDLKEWQASPHARAMGDNFQAVWQKEGKKWECLVCHTSRYDRKAGTYSHEGVGCESCHGAFKADHPDKQKMTLPVTSESCQPCHSITYGEWRVSAHGQKNIRCFDCHKMHGMKTRKTDSDEMCGSCHSKRLESYSHATHHVKGVKCIACHMPEVPGSHVKIKGTGTRGHSFGVGAETCAGCHKEMVHARSDRVVLEQEIERLKGLSSPAVQQELDAKRQEVTDLRLALKTNRRVFIVLVLVAFGLGGALMYGIQHRRHHSPGPQ